MNQKTDYHYNNKSDYLILYHFRKIDDELLKILIFNFRNLIQIKLE